MIPFFIMMMSSLFTGVACVGILLSQIFDLADYPFKVIIISSLFLTTAGSIITVNSVVVQNANSIALFFNRIENLATQLGKFYLRLR